MHPGMNRVGLVLASIVFASTLGFAQGEGKRSRTKTEPPPPPPPPPAIVQPTQPLVSSDSEASLQFADGTKGFSFGFPDGRSPFGNGFVGARFFLSPESNIGAYLLFSSGNQDSFGLGGRYQQYFAKKQRIHLSWFGQLNIGENEGDEDLGIGLAGGLIVEYQLLQDLSFSYESGLAYGSAGDTSVVTTGTSQISLNLYY